MLTLIVVRHIPTPIVGVVGAVQDRTSEAFEDALDWLETTGVLVERVDPADQTSSELGVTVPPSATLPAVFANGELVSEGRYLTRHELAHLVGQATMALPGELVEAVAAIAAAAGVGDGEAIEAAVRQAKATGLAEESISVALRIGADARAAYHIETGGGAVAAPA